MHRVGAFSVEPFFSWLLVMFEVRLCRYVDAGRMCGHVPVPNLRKKDLCGGGGRTGVNLRFADPDTNESHSVSSVSGVAHQACPDHNFCYCGANSRTYISIINNSGLQIHFSTINHQDGPSLVLYKTMKDIQLMK
jgi:hypothetical protein